jgi:hypothetical protein
MKRVDDSSANCVSVSPVLHCLLQFVRKFCYTRLYMNFFSRTFYYTTFAMKRF